MGEYNIGEAINLFLERSQWKQKVIELRMRQEWDEIVGKTISKYTRDISMNKKTLIIYTEVAALKQELYFGKEQLIKNINEYFKEVVVEEVMVR